MPNRIKNFLSSLKAIIVLIYLFTSIIIKIISAYLRLKLRIWKRRIRFRKTLEEKGIDHRVVDKLCKDLPEISLRRIISEFRG